MQILSLLYLIINVLESKHLDKKLTISNNVEDLVYDFAELILF